MKVIKLGLALLLVVLTSSSTKADLLVNGGFEFPTLTLGGFQTYGPGGEPVGFGWFVSSGTIDVGHLPVSPFVQYAAYEGNQVLDLNGNSQGAIFQDFATVAGQTYELTFAYADNPAEGGVSSASILVNDVGTSSNLLSTSVFHSTSTNSPTPHADYSFFTAWFTATGSVTRLAFASTSASNSASGGIILDAVRVTAIPEPSTVVWILAGGVAVASYRRRRT